MYGLDGQTREKGKRHVRAGSWRKWKADSGKKRREDASP